MKKILTLLVTGILATMLSGCWSLRTPGSGPNAEKVYYQTFFGISLESAVYGDGLVVDNK